MRLKYHTIYYYIEIYYITYIHNTYMKSSRHFTAITKAFHKFKEFYHQNNKIIEQIKLCT